MFDEMEGEEPTAGEVRPAKSKAGKKPAKKPEELACACCGKPLSPYQQAQGDQHGNCETCVGDRVTLARHAMQSMIMLENFDAEDVAERAVTFADCLLAQLRARPLKVQP